jgi:hypothetical protein
MAVSRAAGAPGGTAGVNATALISGSPQRRIEFGFQKLLYEAANTRPHSTFQRIEPIVAEKMLVLGGAGGRLRAIHHHGVISAGALTPVLVCFHKLEITPLSNFNHSRDGTIDRRSP